MRSEKSWNEQKEAAVMDFELSVFMNKINQMEDAELRLLVVSLKKENMELRAKEAERRNTDAEIARQYRKLEKEAEELREENRTLKEELSHISDQNSLKANTLFGRRSEKLNGLMNGKGGEEYSRTEDPLNEDADPEQTTKESRPDGKEVHDARQTKKNGRKIGRHEAEIKDLPTKHTYEFDEKSLDEVYGNKGWRIVGWTSTTKKRLIRRLIYVEVIHTPVISVGPGLAMEKIEPEEEKLLSGSDVTPELVAEILNDKFTLGLPLYRIEQDFARDGVRISRQTMDNWVIRFSQEQFSLIYGYMSKLIKKSEYTQCDETTLLVIRDGRAPGSKSFMWVHINSELADEKPVVVFCYEPTRSTDHLRDFYGDDYVGKIICDAYCAYKVYGQEHLDTVIICGCSMHSRRRWAEALRVRDVSGLSQGQINELPEAKALLMIRDIYQEEAKLRTLTPEKRLEGRQKYVKPKVDEYFAFLTTFDLSDPALPERTKDAITYSLNQKQYLCEFLNDGHVPIDNGSCERSIRRYASHRHGWMFCTSPEGAEAMAEMYTISETALKNGANTFYYFKYLLENAPKKVSGSMDAQLEELMPWSEKYKQYETAQIQAHIDQCLPKSDECPITGKSLLVKPRFVA